VNQVVSIFAHLHPALVHGPIGVVVALLLLEAWSRLRGRPSPADASRFLVGLALLSAVVAVATGLAYASADEFHGRAARILEQHRNLGIGAALWCLVAASAHAVWTRRGERRFFVAYVGSIAVAGALVAATGHRGGQLVHGEDFPFGSFDAAGDEGPLVASDGDDETAGSAGRERWPDDPSILTRGERVDFARDVKPLFERSCLKCHGPEKRRGKLRLDKKKYALHGGETGELFVAGDPDASLLIKLVSLPSTDDDVMPEKGKLLSPSEIELLKKWIREGGHWPDDG
jgi:uncharacterized membrane protein